MRFTHIAFKISDACMHRHVLGGLYLASVWFHVLPLDAYYQNQWVLRLMASIGCTALNQWVLLLNAYLPENLKHASNGMGDWI